MSREGPSLTIPSNANVVSVRSEEVGDGTPLALIQFVKMRHGRSEEVGDGTHPEQSIS